MKWLREKCNRRCLIKCCTQAKCTTALMWKEYRSVSSLVQPRDDLHQQLDFHASKHVCLTQTTRHTTLGSNIQNKLLFHSPHSATTASWACQELKAAATAAWCSNDTTLSHETVYFLEAALELREVVSDRGRIGKCFS